MNISRKLFFGLLIGLVALAGLPACSTQSKADLHMMSMDRMPMEVQSAPATVQQAYQFAAANPDVMKNIPCYCG
ncbi:MAG TPA: PCYCGC motif-containing (lipo)protein, partial [Candidatus Paceibacterota bacterium]